MGQLFLLYILLAGWEMVYWAGFSCFVFVPLRRPATQGRDGNILDNLIDRESRSAGSLRAFCCGTPQTADGSRDEAERHGAHEMSCVVLCWLAA
jgi:hypothetical protein